MSGESRVRWDVLTTRPMRQLLAWPVFPLALQVLALAGVAGLAVNGFGIGADMSAGELMTVRKTNLTTLAVWGLWWPGMIAVALAFGRIWCTVCPMERVDGGVGLLGLTFFVAWKAWRWVRDLPGEAVSVGRTGLAGAAVLFTTILVVWVWPEV